MSNERDLPAPAEAAVEARPAKPAETSKGGRQVTLTREFRSAEFFDGPLPPPEVLAKYSDAFAGCAERIVVMAEEQAQHRRSLERMVVESNTKRQATAQWLAFVAFMSLCAGAMLLFWMGKDGTATGVLASTLLGFGGLYLYGQRKQDQELAEKRKPFEPEEPKKLPQRNRD